MSLAMWLTVLMAAILIAISPGPGAVSSMSAGARFGYGATLRLIGGLQTALIIQLAIVALGFGALLATSELAFNLLRFAGAAYLCWLGIQKWRATPVSPLAAGAPKLAARGLFAQGLLVNLTNPKAILFMAALVPQFVDPAAPLLLQYLIIGSTLCAVDVVVMSIYALSAVQMGRWIRNETALRRQNRVFGSLYVAAGALLALTPRTGS